jgi:alpha-tubulin suppressor-like RCC1 family protein
LWRKSQFCSTRYYNFNIKFLILENSKLFCFGSNLNGQLGFENKEIIWVPKENTFFEKLEIKKIVCGDSFSVVLLS